MPGLCACMSFNSQPPEGGWPLTPLHHPDTEGFQLTAARRRLAYISSGNGKSQKFQLTAARRRLGQRLAGCRPISKFQLTAARRRLEMNGAIETVLFTFQLTAARRRLAPLAEVTDAMCRVSTHSRPKAAGV